MNRVEVWVEKKMSLFAKTGWNLLYGHLKRVSAILVCSVLYLPFVIVLVQLNVDGSSHTISPGVAIRNPVTEVFQNQTNQKI